MPLIRCRKCNEEILSDVDACPKCKQLQPFNCAVCGKAIGNLQEFGSSRPFDSDNKPLCPDHAYSICDKCKRPVKKESITIRVTKWEKLSTGHVIPINGGFCQECNANHVEPAPVSNKKGCLGLFLFWAILLMKK
jgi:hypothetical protein